MRLTSCFRPALLAALAATSLAAMAPARAAPGDPIYCIEWVCNYDHTVCGHKMVWCGMQAKPDDTPAPAMLLAKSPPVLPTFGLPKPKPKPTPTSQV